jgi:glycosyltransferase-like protein
MKIALLAHSVNPRGGVVHTLELGDALASLGHDVTVMAPAREGQAFFRSTRCRVALAPLVQAQAQAHAHAQTQADTAAMVQARIDAYLRFLRPHLDLHRYDVLHAQDSISGNALATLVEEGAIAGYVRTVHHLDEFDDARLAAWQRRAFLLAESVYCVSGTWVAHLLQHYGIQATQVANGVNRDTYQPLPSPLDAVVAARYGIDPAGPVFLVVGGVEPRKNTLAVLEAFARVRMALPQAQLVVAGGASLLDHDAYGARFRARLAQLGLGAPGSRAVILTGPVADDAMPSLYRLSDVLVMASLKEGFGLAVLEALAAGIAVVASRRPPFVEYLTDADCTFTDCDSVESIALSMTAALAARTDPEPLLNRFSWQASARHHAALYRTGAARAALVPHPIPVEEPLHACHAFSRTLA